MIDKKRNVHIDPANWLDIYGDTLFRYSLKYINNQTIAEDLVQDTFLAALKSFNSFEGVSSEQTWLIGILKNKISDYYRNIYTNTSQDKKNISIDPDELDYINDGSERGSWKTNRRPAKWSIDSNDPVEKEQFWIYLNKCLDKIDPKLAIIYSLRDIHQVNYKEVCNILTLKPTNLRVMLHRTRKLLRQCLEVNWIEK
jgi:RNA polymerase sigma-70 factor (TIGR02943 family)